MSRDTVSTDSLHEATRSRAKFSGHGNAKGAAGFSTDDEAIGGFLRETGETAIVNPRQEGFTQIRIGAAWDNVQVEKAGFFTKLLKKATQQGVDLDLGCLYELQNGKRGAIQAFGELYGDYDQPPFIRHSGDERTGDKEGDDEYIEINGAQWSEIKKILIYVYIYDGVPDWKSLRPRIGVMVEGEAPLVAEPSIHDSKLSVCVVAGLENVRSGIKMTNYTEYFPGHAEMDRAFGFGLKWADGAKE